MKSKIEGGTLYIVATPIGNLSDFTQRGIDTLKNVDFIAAEDTRVSKKLLNHYDIKKPMISYFEYSNDSKLNEILHRLQKSESCALISDAGTPAISDPGEQLVRKCHENGILVRIVPGASAVVSALAISGQNTKKFIFEGFLPKKSSSRKKYLKELLNYPHTLVFYEAPHRLYDTLLDMLEVFSNRSITIIREMTKIYEENVKTTLEDAVNLYKTKTPLGEFVLVLEGKTTDDIVLSLEQVVKLVNMKIKEGLSISQACKEMADETIFQRREIYKAVLEAKDEKGV